MLKNIKAVLFDLDGTLVDSMWIWKSVDEEYFEKKGLEIAHQFHYTAQNPSVR